MNLLWKFGSALLLSASVFVALLAAEQRYPASGLVLKVDRARKVVVISCDQIPGYMEAMTMPIAVPHGIESLKQGTMVDFTLVVDKESAVAESVRPHFYQGLEP